MHPRGKRPSRLPLLKIANEYLQGVAPAPETATKLKRQGPFGNLLAGEILMDQAAKGPRYTSSTLLAFAESMYWKVVSQTDPGPWRDGYDHAGSRARAQMRLAQGRAARTVYSRGQMPGKHAVKEMYSLLLGQAVTLAAGVRANAFPMEDSAKEVKGVIGELAVLLLAQRYAIREAGCDTWLPLQSLFSEDSGGDCTTETDEFAWDMNVLTPGKTGPETTYMLQVRSHDYGMTPTGPTLHISPDLALTPNEKHLESKIILACEFEARMPHNSHREGRDLDARTEGLLAHLD